MFKKNGTDALSDCPMICTSKDLFSAFSFSSLPELPESQNVLVCGADISLADLAQDDIEKFATTGNANLAVLEKLGVDTVVIDTPPTLGATLATALLLSEQVLIPIEVELSSVTGAINVAQTVLNLKKIAKPDLNLMGVVINRMRRTPRKLKNLDQIKADPGLGAKLIPYMVSDRDSIAESLSEVVPLRQLARKRSAARKALNEIEALSAFVMSKGKPIHSTI